MNNTEDMLRGSNVVQFNPSLNFNDAPPQDTGGYIDTDPVLVARHYKALFGYCEADEWVALRSFPERPGVTGEPINEWILNDHRAPERVAAFAAAAHARGYSCFILPATVSGNGKAKAEDVRRFTSILVDIDAGDISAKLAHLTRFLGRPSLVIESGGRVDDGQAKVHAYWLLTEPVEGECVVTVGRLRHIIAQKVGADPAFQRVSQVVRVCGSVHAKGGNQNLVSIRDHNQLEYEFDDLAQAILDMPPLPGIHVAPVQSDVFSLDFNTATSDRPAASDVALSVVHEGGVDGITRFDALSQVIGMWIRRAHEGKIPLERAWEEIRDYNAACVRPPWDEKRLQQEAENLWKKHVKDHGEAKPYVPPAEKAAKIVSFTLGEYDDDTSPMPADLIEPRFLTPRGMAVIGGAPKVGKTDFLLHLLIHAAAGYPWLGMRPTRPLKIFYEQAELEYHYLRERIKSLPPELRRAARNNLAITPRFKGILNDDGLIASIEECRRRFPDGPDIIVIDPIRNVFDGGPDGGGENDSMAMMHFLQERVEAFRDAVNPEAGIILAHHTRKLQKKQVEEDPMQALSGSGALRGYYTSGALIWRPDETQDERMIHFELRNSNDGGIPRKKVKKEAGMWVEVNDEGERVYGATQYDKAKAQHLRDREAILGILLDEAGKLHPKLYQKTDFAKAYAFAGGLGSDTAIGKRIDNLIHTGYIRFTDGAEFGLPKPSNRSYGYMVVEGMQWGPDKGFVDGDTGEYADTDPVPVLPKTWVGTSGTRNPVEDPYHWVYSDAPKAD